MFDFKMIIENIKKRVSNPLIKNSLYLMLTTLSGAGSGFFFWIFAARFYTPENVGLAAAIISVMSFLSILAKLGFDIGTIRYLPSAENKSNMINSCLTIIFIASVTLSIIFLIGLGIFSPTLLFIRQSPLFLISFIIITIANSLFMTQNFIFAALRNAKYSYLQNLIAIFRIIILPLFITLGVFGAYIAYGLGIFFACIAGNLFLVKLISSYKPTFVIDKDIVISMFHFSFGNYIATIFEGIPSFLLPIIVLNVLGAESNAYFYIAWAFSALLLMIPRATSISLFAEGSHEPDDFRNDLATSLKFVMSLLVIFIFAFFLFGRDILSLFGTSYSKNAYEILWVFSIASIPFSINTFYVTIKRVQNQIMHVICIHTFIAIFSIAGGYIFMSRYGLIGVAMAWLLGNGIASIFAGIAMFRMNNISIDG